MKHTQTKPRLRVLFYLLLIIGVLGGGLYWWFGRTTPAAQSALNPAATVQSIPARPLPPSLMRLTARELASLPVIDGFESPLGTQHGAFVYDAQPFAAPNKKRDGYHSGQDLNGIGGANSDTHLPIYAAARGLVVYNGTPSPAWGHVVVLAHRLPDKRVVQTLYAHLERSTVGVGQLLGRGEPLGTVGSASGRYLAHLHFECIASRAMEAGQTAYHDTGTMNRVNPTELFAAYPAPTHPDAFSQVRRLLQQETLKATPSTTPSSLPEGSIQINPSHFLSPSS